MDDSRHIIAKNVAALFKTGDIVNLGVGIPTLTVNYISEDVEVIVHAECGTIGCGSMPCNENINYDIVDATSDPVTLIPKGSCTDSAMSFGIVRGGHLDYTVLGAMEVDEEGSLANWLIPGKAVTGMGGAMDLVVGAKRVVVATTHTSKDGKPKILKKCSLPLTAAGAVTDIVTELAVMEIINNEIRVVKMEEHITREELQNKTGAKLIFDETIEMMETIG